MQGVSEGLLGIGCHLGIALSGRGGTHIGPIRHDGGVGRHRHEAPDYRADLVKCEVVGVGAHAQPVSGEPEPRAVRQHALGGELLAMALQQQGCMPGR